MTRQRQNAYWPSVQTRRHGFTLLEVMVALAVLAIALSAIMRAAGSATRNIEEVKVRTLALWTAENLLAEHRIRQDWLSVGRYEGEVSQGANLFRWQEDVQLTPNAQFRRIDIRVSAIKSAGDTGESAPTLVQLGGFLTASGKRQ